MTVGEANLLAGGLVMRAGEPGDVDQLVAQNTAAFGPQDGPDVRCYLEHGPGPDAWSVVVDGTRIVSSVAGLPIVVRYDGVELAGCQIEYVVTDPPYQRRGLVQAQIGWHHRRSAERGDLLQVIGGIPYFYRRFGYGYGLDHPALFVFDGGGAIASTQVDDAGLSVRDARAGDLDQLVSLEGLRPGDGVRVPRAPDRWALRLALASASEHQHLLVAERRGVVCGWAQLLAHPDANRIDLLPSLASTREASLALLRSSIELADDLVLVAFDNPGTTFGATLDAVGKRFTLGYGFYVRVADPLALLQTLRPLLSERLSASRFVDAQGALEISLYRSGVRLKYDGGQVVDVTACPPVEDPLLTNRVGVPPEWFPALVLGRWGASGLAERVDDVLLGREQALMDTLFPRRPSDVAGEL